MVRSAVIADFLPLVCVRYIHIYAPITQILCYFLDVLRVGMVVQSPHHHNTRDRRPRSTASHWKS